jgi:hypothetical protein
LFSITAVDVGELKEMTMIYRIDSLRRGGRELLTESAPGSGDGGGADKVGGVVEAAEDAGGNVGADPLQEVPAAGLRRRHGPPSLLLLGSRVRRRDEEEKGESAMTSEVI